MPDRKPCYTHSKTSFCNCGLSGWHMQAVQLPVAGCTARNCGTKKITKDSRILPRALRGFTMCTAEFLRGITAFSTRYRRISLRNITAFSTRHRHAPCKVSPHPLPGIPYPFAQLRTLVRQNGRQSRTRNGQAGTRLWNYGTHLWIFSPILCATPIHIIDIYRK